MWCWCWLMCWTWQRGIKIWRFELFTCHSGWFSAHLYSGTCLVWEAQDVGNWKPFPNVTAILQSCQHTRQKLTAHSTADALANYQQEALLNHRTINWSFMHHCQIFLSLIWIWLAEQRKHLILWTVTTITAKNLCLWQWSFVSVPLANEN